ncbi:hypothetical protein [Aliikangiella maris]|uniref:PKD domain-containing protein n=2 Tax=Aliikangiella maris TaxID=3162458 RepID=A0ABV3MUC9_9GAMM
MEGLLCYPPATSRNKFYPLITTNRLLFILLFILACGSGATSSQAEFIEEIPSSEISENTPPTAHFTIQNSAKPGQVILLDASTSSDAENDPLTYHWELTTPASSSSELLTTTK